MEARNEQYETLLERLDEQRDAYFEIEKQVRDLLLVRRESDPHGGPGSPASPKFSLSPPLSPGPFDAAAAAGRNKGGPGSIAVETISKATTGGDSSDSEDEEDYYVQTPLEPEEYDHEGLRRHLRETKWDANSALVLEGVADNSDFLKKDTLFPTRSGPVPDRSHFSHHQVFDVGADGAPLAVELTESERLPSNALEIWETIRKVNPLGRERKAVGRITILRELSPILYGAAHYALHRHFDVAELFGALVAEGHSHARLTRAFDADERRRRTFVFSFEYFTIIGEDCQPPSWQLADRQEDRSAHHIAIARASSVVALRLGGAPMRKLRNRSRRLVTSRSGNGTHQSPYGFVYDAFAPWHLVNLQSYPDWRSSTETHNSTRHYVNGVEAFVVTVLGELQDAQTRFDDIYKHITQLVTPPLDFMFDPKVRERLLFEDEDFTYVRRYFWAGQTLAIVQESVKAMVDACEDGFTSAVWEGTHPTVWPLAEGGATSARNDHYLKRMGQLRARVDEEVENLRDLVRKIEARRKEINALREELYVGTSIQESRKSVENAIITVQQGHNIRILTLVSMLFLPLTFVTSVFGMTDMPTDNDMWRFGIVTTTVCVPFFILIGSLNSNRGLRFWMNKWNLFVHGTGAFFVWLGIKLGRRPPQDEGDTDSGSLSRPSSVSQDHVDFNKRRRRRSSTMYLGNNSGGESTSDGLSRREMAEKDMPSMSRDSTWSMVADKDIPALSPTQPSRLTNLMVSELKRKRTIRYSPGV